MADDFSARTRLRDVVVVGGGCYGTFYARQLTRARERGKLEFRRAILVDRDAGCLAARELGAGPERTIVVAEWGQFFDEWLAGDADPLDAIVPSPLMPHLMFEWLVRQARRRWPGRQVDQIPLLTEAGTPYDMLAPDGTRYVSYADWLCPTHCIEPALCPMTRAPRTWEMSEAVIDLAARAHTLADPVVFRCRHRAFGVGMFDVEEVLGGDARLRRAGEAGSAVDLLVGTVSSCHGAVSRIRLGAWAGAEPPGVLYLSGSGATPA